MLRKSRSIYGILLRMGGPNSLRASESVFRPPRSTVPPSGTFTVVLTVIVVKLGCWKNIWKTVSGGAPVEPGPGPNRKVVTVICTGTRGNWADAKLVNVGVRLRRTKRRSAEITGVTVRSTPVGIGALVGVKNRLPRPVTLAVTPIRKKAVSVTLMVAVWP